MFNNYKVGAIEIKNKNNGEDAFFGGAPFKNCGIFGKKRSGKSNLVYHLLRNTLDKNTDIYIFSPTTRRDDTYIQCVKELKDNGNNVEVFDSLYDTYYEGKRKKNVHLLKELFNSFTAEEQLDEEEEENKSKKKKKKEQTGEGNKYRNPYEYKLTREMFGQYHLYDLMFGNNQPKNEEHKENIKRNKPKMKKPRGKKIFPQKCILFDDLSDEIRDPYVSAMLKKNRHYFCQTIISTQNIMDIHASSRGQFDIVIAFKAIPREKVDVLRKMMDVPIEEKDFYRLYMEATKEPYAFMFCDCRNGIIRKNFDEIIYQ